MENTFVTTNAFSVQSITERVINRIYVASTTVLLQSILETCLNVSPAELKALFEELDRHTAAEFANMLCAETSRHQNRFVAKFRTYSGFVLFRNTIEIARLEHIEFHSPHVERGISKRQKEGCIGALHQFCQPAQSAWNS